MEIITALQTRVDPTVFDPPSVYDGRKNLFAPAELPFGESGMKEVCVSYHLVLNATRERVDLMKY